MEEYIIPRERLNGMIVSLEKLSDLFPKRRQKLQIHQIIKSLNTERGTSRGQDKKDFFSLSDIQILLQKHIQSIDELDEILSTIGKGRRSIRASLADVLRDA